MSYTNDNRRPPQPEDTGSAADIDVSSDIELSADDLNNEPELEAIMDRLREIGLTLDAPPPLVAELARAAFETRDLDAELAVLTADSEFDVLELVRSVQAEPRMVSFETESITVELQLDRQDSSLVVRGLVVGAVGEIVLDTGDQRITAQLDERGWFLADDVPAGALRLRIRGADGSNVTTEWITT
jgi:hypothetical protein